MVDISVSAPHIAVNRSGVSDGRRLAAVMGMARKLGLERPLSSRPSSQRDLLVGGARVEIVSLVRYGEPVKHHP